MHHEAYDAVAQFLQTIALPTRVVELGSRNINGSVRPLFRGVSYVGVDTLAGVGVDVVADAAAFVPESVPDCVICCEVLEHAANAPEIVANALRMLAPGGSLIVTCAAAERVPHSAIDGGTVHNGEFYRLITPEELEGWFTAAGAADVDVVHRADRGDLYAVGTKREDA